MYKLILVEKEKTIHFNRPNEKALSFLFQQVLIAKYFSAHEKIQNVFKS